MAQDVFGLLAEMNRKIDTITERREGTQELKGLAGISAGERSPGNAAQGASRGRPTFNSTGQTATHSAQDPGERIKLEVEKQVSFGDKGGASGPSGQSKNAALATDPSFE